VGATETIGYLATLDAKGHPGAAGATANPGYFSSDANGGQQSPLWISYGTTAAGGASGSNATYQANAYAANFYAANNDPRLGQVYSATSTPNATATTGLLDGVIEPISGGAVVASPFGDGTPPNGITPPGTTRANLSPSKFGLGVLKAPTMNANILSAAEALFLQAEGVQAGYISVLNEPGTPQALYNMGIAASFADDLVPNAAGAAATYAAQPQIAYPAGAPGIITAAQQQAIIVQKWAALNLYGAFEAFNELRRTGYPNNIPLSIAPPANYPGQVTRIPYPNTEYSTNSTNVVAQGTISIFTSKIFWAK